MPTGLREVRPQAAQANLGHWALAGLPGPPVASLQLLEVLEGCCQRTPLRLLRHPSKLGPPLQRRSLSPRQLQLLWLAWFLRTCRPLSVLLMPSIST